MIPDRPSLTRHEIMSELRYGDEIIVASRVAGDASGAFVADEHPPFTSPEVRAEFAGYTITADGARQSIWVIDAAGRTREVVLDWARIWRAHEPDAPTREPARVVCARVGCGLEIRRDARRVWRHVGDRPTHRARPPLHVTSFGAYAPAEAEAVAAELGIPFLEAARRLAAGSYVFAPGAEIPTPEERERIDAALEPGIPHDEPLRYPLADGIVGWALTPGPDGHECAGCGRAVGERHPRGCPELAHPPAMRRLSPRAERASSASDTRQEHIMAHTHTNTLGDLAAIDQDTASAAIQRAFATMAIASDDYAHEQSDVETLVNLPAEDKHAWIATLTLDEAREVLSRIAGVREEHYARAKRTEPLEEFIRDALRDTSRHGLDLAEAVEGGSVARSSGARG